MDGELLIGENFFVHDLMKTFHEGTDRTTRMDIWEIFYHLWIERIRTTITISECGSEIIEYGIGIGLIIPF